MASDAKSGVFKIGLTYVTISYDTEKKILTWDAPPDSTNKSTSTITNVSVEDIYAVQTANNTWTIHYVGKKTTREPGQNLAEWSPASVAFTGENAQICTEWATCIQEAINDTGQERPSRLLVLLNPNSGKGEAVKNYNKIAKPLFSLAGVTADVIETTSSSHVDEVIADYDLTTVDGVISGGGDGTFTLVATALIRRVMKDAGRDPDDCEQDLVYSHIRLGIFPGGTGQAVVKSFTGGTDCTTVILQTILGHTTPGKLMTIHNNKRLMACASLLFSYGVLANSFRKAEQLSRSLGFFRYIVAMAGQVKSFHQPHILKFSYRQKEEESSTEEWVTETRAYKMISGHAFHMMGSKGSNYYVDTMSLLNMDETGTRGNFAKYMYHAMSNNERAGTAPCFHRAFSKHVKLELPDIPTGEESRHIFGYDGETFDAEPGLVNIRLQNDVFKAYGTGYSPPSSTTD